MRNVIPSVYFQFQSTLPRGERLFMAPDRNIDTLFQSTLPRGERRIEPEQIDASALISIHAPTRGATVLVEQELTLPKFQSTLPRGERPSGLSRISSALKFQSTLPRGERQTTGADRPEPINFNPRSHEGSDTKSSTSSMDEVNFNPRSHEGSDSNFRQKVLFSLSKNCLKYLILTTNYFN